MSAGLGEPRRERRARAARPRQQARANRGMSAGARAARRRQRARAEHGRERGASTGARAKRATREWARASMGREHVSSGDTTEARVDGAEARAACAPRE
jgi:hypothetical protein